MSQKSKSENNPAKFVTKTECLQTSTAIREELSLIRTALIGDDMRGGLVKDVADLKSQGSTVSLIVKSIVVPIIVAVVTAVIITGIK